MKRALACITLLVSLCAAQTFEVASIRQNQSGDRHSNISVPDGPDGARLITQNVSLMTLIQRAYGVRQYQVEGPDWLRDPKFDIQAALPTGVRRDKIPPALQALLAERFKLALHRETRELPIYALIVAKGGPKMQAASEPNSTSGTWQDRGHYKAQNESLAHFCEILSLNLTRPVIDMTQLGGRYDFAIDYTDERGSDDSADAPSLFTALQEVLGLKLETRRGPVEMLVLDHVETTATEN
jgi:uncharacterized protein (TIGR03435 family)